MTTHNVNFRGKIRKIFIWLSLLSTVMEFADYLYCRVKIDHKPELLQSVA